LIAVSTPEVAVGQPRHNRSPQFDYTALNGSDAGHSWAAAINDRGVVAGTATVSVSTMMGTGFIWTESDGFTTIVEDAVVWDINNKAQVVGRYRCSSEVECAAGFSWSPSTGVEDLGNFFPYAVNNRGEMAGTCGEFTPCAIIGGSLVEIAVGSDVAIAFDINDRGVVAGWMYGPPDEEGGRGSVAFTWSPRSGVIILDAADADDTTANAVNKHGVVAGSLTYNSTIGVSSRINAATWTQGQPFILHGRDWTSARAINDRGWTAGSLSVGGSGPNLPMFWIPGQSPVQLPLSNGTGGFATDINKSGQVVGYVYTSMGTMQAVLWRPR
jgi:hypothetical protein